MDITIQDECILMGAPRVIKKSGGYLLNLIQRIVENYDSTDIDHVALLADIQYARDNCREIIATTKLMQDSIEKLRSEITELSQN